MNSWSVSALPSHCLENGSWVLNINRIYWMLIDILTCMFTYYGIYARMLSFIQLKDSLKTIKRSHELKNWFLFVPNKSANWNKIGIFDEIHAWIMVNGNLFLKLLRFIKHSQILKKSREINTNMWPKFKKNIWVLNKAEKHRLPNFYIFSNVKFYSLVNKKLNIWNIRREIHVILSILEH